MSLPANGRKAAASKTTKGIPTGVLLIVVATLAYETYTGQDVDLETYLPLLIPMGLGGLLKHGIDARAGRLNGGGAGGALGGALAAAARSDPGAPPYGGGGAPTSGLAQPAPAQGAGGLDKTTLNNVVQAAVSAALKAQRK